MDVLAGRTEIDFITRQMFAVEPRPESPKTRQLLEEIARRESSPSYQRILNNAYAPSARRGDNPQEIPPSGQLRRLIDYLIPAVVVYRLQTTAREIFRLTKIDRKYWKKVYDAVPFDLRKKFERDAKELTDAIFAYHREQGQERAPDQIKSSGEVLEDDFMDSARIVLNDFYGQQRTDFVAAVGQRLKLFMLLDQNTVYTPYGELILATGFLQEALRQRTLYEYITVENHDAEEGKPTTLLVHESVPRTKGKDGKVTVYGQHSKSVEDPEFFVQLMTQAVNMLVYHHDRVVEAWLMPREQAEAVKRGERERPAHPGFYQIHHNPPVQYV